MGLKKVKNHIIISTDTEKAFDKIQYLFKIKTYHIANKKDPNWKGGCTTVTICRRHATYIESPKNNTQKWIDLLHEFSKVVGYKINIQKLVAFLHSDNEISERECPLKSHQKIYGRNKQYYKVIILQLKKKRKLPWEKKCLTKKKKPRNKLDQGGEKLTCWEL